MAHNDVPMTMYRTMVVTNEERHCAMVVEKHMTALMKLETRRATSRERAISGPDCCRRNMYIIQYLSE